MTAQETIPRNRMPVPEAFRSIPPAIDEEDFGDRRRTRPRVGGIGGFGGIIGTVGLEGIAEAIGQLGGEIIGDQLYGLTPEEARQLKERELELRRRMGAHEADFDRLMRGQVEMEEAIPPDFDVWSEGGEVRRSADGRRVLRRFPGVPGRPRKVVFPAPAPPPVRRSRMQRAMQRVRTATRNPYAQLGILGLGLLGGRRSARDAVPVVPLVPLPVPEELPPIPAPLTPSIDGLLPYWSPVTGLSAASSATQRCDCKPKKRKPGKRCLARAPVRWAGGPRKGKSAGTRCIRRES